MSRNIKQSRTTTAKLIQATAAVALIATGHASAATLTWDGSTGTDEWDALDGGSGGFDTNWTGGTGAEIANLDDSVFFTDLANRFSRNIDLNGDRQVLSATFDSATLADGQPDLNYIIGLTPGGDTLTLIDGDLTVLDGNVLFNSDVDYRLSGRWDIANGSTVTLDGQLTGIGPGRLTKSGAGTLNLSAGGTLDAFRIDDGVVDITGGTYVAGQLSGSGTLKVSNGEIDFGNAGSIARLEIEPAGRVSTDDALSANILTGEGTLNLDAGGSFTAGISNGSSTFAGTIEGLGSLVKSGFGVLTLSGTNTYTGTTTIDAGILAVTGGSAIADTGAVVVNDRLQIDANETIGSLAGVGQVALNGGTLTIDDSADRTFGGFFVGSNDLTLSGSGALTLTGPSSSTGTFNVSGTSTLRLAQASGFTLADTADVAIGTNGTLALDVDETIGGLSGAGNVDLGSSTLTVTEAGGYDGQITGTGGLTFDIGDGNNFTLTSVANTRVNDYSGPTTIASGQLTISGSRAIGDESDLIVNGALDLSGNETVGSLAGSGDIVLSGSFRHGRNNASTTFSGTLSGISPFEKQGTGTIRLTGDSVASGFSGSFRVSDGVVSIASPNSVGTGTVTVATSATLNFENNLTFTNVLNVTNGFLTTSSNETVTLNNSSFGLNGGVRFGDGVTSSFFVLAPDNLALGGADAISVSENATLVFGNEAAATIGSRAATVDGTLDLNGFDATLGQFLGAGTGVVTSNSGDATLTVFGNLEFAGSITDGTSGVVDLVVDVENDTRAFTLSGNNTFSGRTTVVGTTGTDRSVLSVAGPNAAITNTASLSVTGALAELVVSEGATVKVVDNIGVSDNAELTVIGDGTLFEAGNSIFVNGDTEGTLTVGSNAVFQIVAPSADERFFIGSADGSTGVVDVLLGGTLEYVPDGTSPFRTFVGTQFDTAQGELNIRSGGQVTLARTDVGNDSSGNGASGVINVDGFGTTLNIIQSVTGESTGNGAGDLILGSGGNGTLNITDGGEVNVFDDIFVALGDDSTGELNVFDGTLNIGDGLFVGYNNTGPLTVGVGAQITANRFVVTNSDSNPNITPGDAVVTFQLSKDGNGDEANGRIDAADFSFRSGTRELVLDLDPNVSYEIGDTFVLVDYDTIGNNLAGAVTEQVFDNIDDGSFVFFDGVGFLFDYADDRFGGTAFTATVAIPEPAGLALFGLGGLLATRRQRRAFGSCCNLQ
ncbi:MAG: autotransporter-associated beta strand repeat-containing protein [Planctomycetota bacterium]